MKINLDCKEVNKVVQKVTNVYCGIKWSWCKSQPNFLRKPNCNEISHTPLIATQGESVNGSLDLDKLNHWSITMHAAKTWNSAKKKNWNSASQWTRFWDGLVVGLYAPKTIYAWAWSMHTLPLLTIRILYSNHHYLSDHSAIYLNHHLLANNFAFRFFTSFCFVVFNLTLWRFIRLEQHH